MHNKEGNGAKGKKKLQFIQINLLQVGKKPIRDDMTFSIFVLPYDLQMVKKKIKDTYNIPKKVWNKYMEKTR